MLTGRHWLAGGGATGQLALLGFLPRSWTYICNLYSRRSGRALQKACELLCWWRTLDLELEAELDEGALAELDPDAHALALLRSEHLGKASDAPSSVSCTRHVTGLAPDEIESGWSKHAHFAMPPVMCNSNVRAMLKDPLSHKELAGRDRTTPLKLVSATLVPAEMRLRSWLLRVCTLVTRPMMCGVAVWVLQPSVRSTDAHTARVSLVCASVRWLSVLTTSGSAV